MSDYAMPMLILNMGSEMLYILEQRLVAQNITIEKQYRVLLDVINTMFSTKFMDELLRKQHIYTTYPYSIRTILEVSEICSKNGRFRNHDLKTNENEPEII